MLRKVALAAAVVGLLLIRSQVSEAYIGPGASVTVIGTVVALFGAIVLAIIGFVWYPVKRLRARMRSRRTADERGRKASPS